MDNAKAKVNVKVRVKRSTEKAVLLCFPNGKEVWFPKSTVHSQFDGNQNSFQQTISVDAWILEKNGLPMPSVGQIEGITQPPYQPPAAQQPYVPQSQQPLQGLEPIGISFPTSAPPAQQPGSVRVNCKIVGQTSMEGKKGSFKVVDQNGLETSIPRWRVQNFQQFSVGYIGDLYVQTSVANQDGSPYEVRWGAPKQAPTALPGTSTDPTKTGKCAVCGKTINPKYTTCYTCPKAANKASNGKKYSGLFFKEFATKQQVVAWSQLVKDNTFIKQVDREDITYVVWYLQIRKEGEVTGTL